MVNVHPCFVLAVMVPKGMRERSSLIRTEGEMDSTALSLQPRWRNDHINSSSPIVPLKRCHPFKCIIMNELWEMSTAEVSPFVVKNVSMATTVHGTLVSG